MSCSEYSVTQILNYLIENNLLKQTKIEGLADHYNPLMFFIDGNELQAREGMRDSVREYVYYLIDLIQKGRDPKELCKLLNESLNQLHQIKI
jgi:hypothetical protein